MHRLSRRMVVALVASAVAVSAAGVAYAGTITTPTGNPFVVPGDAAGNPLPFNIVATGYTPGTQAFVEQCNGVASTSPGWSPTVDCDLGTSPAGAIVQPDGSATWLASDPNHAFPVFKGESPQSLFNCLSPNQAPMTPINGLPDYRNCQVRVSSNNGVVTSDQAFLNIQLPDAPTTTTTTTTTTTSTSTSTTTSTTSTSTTTTVPQTTTTTTVPQSGTPAGSCTGEKLLLKTATTAPAFTDQTAPVTLSGAPLTDLATKTKFLGSCSGLVEPSNNPGGPLPASLSTSAMTLKLSGVASCASTPAARSVDGTASGGYSLSGLLNIKFTQLDSLLKPFALQAVVTATGFDAASPDVLDLTGVVKAGVSRGATVHAQLYMDPVTKINPALKPPSGTGYAFSSAQLNACQDGTAGNASVTAVQMGDGISLNNTTGVSGISFSFPASLPTPGTSAGSCTGEKLLLKTATTAPAFTDQTAPVTLSGAPLTDLATKAKFLGSCSGLLEPSNNPGGPLPSSLTTSAMTFKLTGVASCASTPAARSVDGTASGGYSLSGLLSIKFTQLDGLLKPFALQAYVTATGVDATSPDVLDLTGVVVSGVSRGATVHAQLYLDPVTKINPALKPPSGTGYAFSSAQLNACQDGTAGNASVTAVQVGDGTSLNNTAGVSGISFSFLHS